MYAALKHEFHDHVYLLCRASLQKRDGALELHRSRQSASEHTLNRILSSESVQAMRKALGRFSKGKQEEDDKGPQGHTEGATDPDFWSAQTSVTARSKAAALSRKPGTLAT